MKIGIIIVFRNNENDIDKNVFINRLKKISNLEICLVNNASNDRTFELLQDVSSFCPNVSLVNIKKFKTQVSAVRSGARFMSSQFNLSHLGYIVVSFLNLEKNGLNELITLISENENQIIDCNKIAIKKTKFKQTLFKSIFSVIDYLRKIKIEINFINLQTLSRL